VELEWIAAIVVAGIWGAIFLYKLERIKTKKVKAEIKVGQFLGGSVEWQESDK
jgi:hypothetical protein